MPRIYLEIALSSEDIKISCVNDTLEVAIPDVQSQTWLKLRIRNLASN